MKLPSLKLVVLLTLVSATIGKADYALSEIKTAEAGTLLDVEPSIAFKANQRSIIKQVRELIKRTKANGNEHAILLAKSASGKYEYGDYQTSSKEIVLHINFNRIPKGFKSVGMLYSNPNNSVETLSYNVDEGEASIDKNFNIIGGTQAYETPVTGLSNDDVLYAYRTGTFVVAALPNGSMYYYYPKLGSELAANPTFDDAAHAGVFGKL